MESPLGARRSEGSRWDRVSRGKVGGKEDEALEQAESFHSSLQIHFKGKSCSFPEEAVPGGRINVSVYAVYPDGVSKPSCGQGKPRGVEKLPPAATELRSSAGPSVPAVPTASSFVD